jgi:hypothetical protein
MEIEEQILVILKLKEMTGLGYDEYLLKEKRSSGAAQRVGLVV